MNVVESIQKLFDAQRKIHPYDGTATLVFKTSCVLVKTGVDIIFSYYNHFRSHTHLKNNKMYITYRHSDGEKYTIIMNKKRKARNRKEYYTCIYDKHDNEPCEFCITLKKYIKEFQGPFNDFHGSSLCPRDLGLSNLVVFTEDDHEDTLVRFERDELFTSS